MSKAWFLPIIIFLNFSAFSYEKPSAFIIKVYDDKVRVLSPTKYDPLLSVVIENKTMAKLKGKIETGSGEVLKFVSILPGKFTSVNVKKLKTQKLFFVPLSPPLQKVELKIGNKPYEIPPKQKS